MRATPPSAWHSIESMKWWRALPLAPMQPYALALLRIVTGYMLLLHGTSKVFQFPDTGHAAALNLATLGGWSGILELIGGALVLIGWFTRPAAFIVSGEMAFAYFIGHASHGNALLPLVNRGELAVLYCFVCLFLAVAGAGAWSIDGRRR
jgi:putative oxidoreductase